MRRKRYSVTPAFPPTHLPVQILRRVSDRLDRIVNIDRRHQKAIALLLLKSTGEAGPGRDRSEAAVTRTAPSRTCREKVAMTTTSGGNEDVPSVTFGPDFQSLPTGGRTTGAQPDTGFGVGSNTGSKTRRRRKKIRREGGALFRKRGKGINSRSLQGGHRGLMGMPSAKRRAGDDDIGRIIACVRKGRDHIFSDSGNCGSELGVASRSPSPSPRLLVADEVRGVMYGLGARLGRASEREDRWL